MWKQARRITGHGYNGISYKSATASFRTFPFEHLCQNNPDVRGQFE